MSVFKGVSNINRPDVSENLRDNVITFIDWGMINAGGFYNVSIPTSGAYGGNFHILRPVSDPRYTSGQIWEGARSNWVWESGLSTTTQPVSISGIFVNNSFLPNNSGYYIDYPNGRVVFTTPIATSSTVKVAHSFKMAKVIDANQMRFFQMLQQNSFRVDDTNFMVGSGIFKALNETRLQAPVIAIEMPINTNQEGYELGSSSQWLNTDMILHVLTEDSSIGNRICDALTRQKEKVIFMFDSYLMGLNNDFPLDYRGATNTGAKTYPTLISASGSGGYRYTFGVDDGRMRVAEASASNGSWLSSKLYHKTVKWTMEVIMLYN